METAKVFLRLPRVNPGYFRYLQQHAVRITPGKQSNPVTPRIAMLLGVTGICMSGYSSRQLALHHKPSTRRRH
ncbi:hypothetical protein JZ751_004911 [Albula glossodonta]|uniref:Uncharacterized protein n=1 Tax=Albula glossodonta TaxID=121402 RepID=A0A8T2P4A8_9TELE|nr:hypothetical protein JZ751_004911 [Albula glossodonta]